MNFSNADISSAHGELRSSSTDFLISSDCSFTESRMRFRYSSKAFF